MKDETAGVDVEEYIGLKLSVLFVAGNSSEHKKQRVLIEMLLR